MNQIVVNFIECDPQPSKGYNLKWRVLGSSDPYTDAGNFFTSPAIFTDGTNPDGTQYEGTLTAQGRNTDCDPVSWNTEQSSGSSSSGFDNSSCGAGLTLNTPDPQYVDLGFTDINVDGASHVDISYDVMVRPNRLTLYDNGVFHSTTNWKGIAPYPGPWGGSLSTLTTGVLGFNPIPGHSYKLRIEVGPAGPAPYDVADDLIINIICT